VDNTREEIDVFDISLVRFSGRVGRVRPLGHHFHDHQLRRTSVHPLQMLILHTPIVIDGVVVSAARSTAGAIWLIQSVRILYDLLGSVLAAYATNKAPKSAFSVDFLLFLSAGITVLGCVHAANW